MGPKTSSETSKKQLSGSVNEMRSLVSVIGVYREKIIWTCRIQFCQPCRHKSLQDSKKSFGQCSQKKEKPFLLIKNVWSECFCGQDVECSFINTAEIFPSHGRKKAHGPNVKKKLFFNREFWLKMFFSTGRSQF